MRVTKAIREYVEDEIYKKYNAKEQAIGQEYWDEKKEIEDEILEIAADANRRAIALAESRGYEVTKGYRGDGLIFMSPNFGKRDVEKQIQDDRRQLQDRRRAKVKQILFDLEVGSTTKNELVEMIDGIEVD